MPESLERALGTAASPRWLERLAKTQNDSVSAEVTIFKSVLSYLIEVRGLNVYVQVCEKHGKALNEQMKVFKDAPPTPPIRSPPLAAAGARNLLCSTCNYGFHPCENQQKVF